MCKDEQKQAEEISQLAIASLVLALMAFFMKLLGSRPLLSSSIKYNLLMVGVALFLGISYFVIYDKKERNTRSMGCAIGGIVLSLFAIPFDLSAPVCNKASFCMTHLHAVETAMFLYANDHNQYPPVDKWCDLLINNYDLTESILVCPAALEKGDKGPCHYAINPRCQLGSPPDTVLAFETKGGWNQHGGVELATTEHHDGRCCVLFNDGHVEAVEAPAKLNWGTESADTK
jgi:prepilin-type processing-associated H-X9-DG protein